MTSRYVGGSGYVDGVILSRSVSRTFRVGVVGGLQPTWSDAAPREELRKFGAFVAYEGDPSAPTNWRASVAATGEYGDADVSREFLRLSSQMRRGPWFLAPSVEVDVNRGWRETRSGTTLSVSNVYVTSRYAPTRALSASLTYDGRANVVTLETRSVPDSIFDDATRHGLRSSVRLRLPGQWTLSVGGGLRGREGTGTSRNWNGSVTYAGLLDRRLSISARYQRFDGPLASGSNPSVLILNSFRGGHTAGVNVGAYIYDSFGSGTIRNFWTRVHGTYETRFGVYVRAEIQHDWGDDIQRDEITGGIGYRF